MTQSNLNLYTPPGARHVALGGGDRLRRAVLKWCGGACALAVLAGPAAAQQAQDGPFRETLAEAWSTGPLLATSPNGPPRGHVLFEPYVYDVIETGRFDGRGARRSTPRAETFGSQSYVIYGVSDRFSVGLIPRLGYGQPSIGPRSSHPIVGDLTAQAQYQLTQFKEGSWIPTLALNIQEMLPTGRYDRLDRMSDGFGAGAYSTSLALYSQSYFWTSGGRILRTRLDLSYSMSGHAEVRGRSVYGTNAGFRGRAHPGDTAQADFAFEYSLTRNWVLAMDLAFERDAGAAVSGAYSSTPFEPAALRSRSGPSKSFYAAPAIEYNFSSRVGVIFGVRLKSAGRNTSATATPVAAINLVY
jgi:hypothetical protein